MNKWLRCKRTLYDNLRFTWHLFPRVNTLDKKASEWRSNSWFLTEPFTKERRKAALPLTSLIAKPICYTGRQFQANSHWKTNADLSVRIEEYFVSIISRGLVRFHSPVDRLVRRRRREWRWTWFVSIESLWNSFYWFIVEKYDLLECIDRCSKLIKIVLDLLDQLHQTEGLMRRRTAEEEW